VLVVVTEPKLLVATGLLGSNPCSISELGLPALGWLKRFPASARNWNVKFSQTLKLLKREKFTLL
jgi:hypothetical protein